MAQVALQPRFEVGQIIHHNRFDYRGVVIAVDPVFRGTDEWYERVAKSRPAKDRPWYRVLVDDAPYETYVAERHLDRDESAKPVRHPMLFMHFDALEGGRYIRNRLMN